MLLKWRYWIILGYLAMGYAAFQMVACNIVPSWGQWYSSSPYYREQVDSLLHHQFCLSKNPSDLKMDLCWSGGGVQQVWGLGVPFWQLIFDSLARFAGVPHFPDRIALALFMALATFIFLNTVLGETNRFHASLSKRLQVPVAAGVILIVLFFAPLLNLLRSALDHYGEPMLYEYFFSTILACGIYTLSQNAKWWKFYILCFLAGLGAFIRPTLEFYGFSTLVVGALAMVWGRHKNQSRIGRSDPSHFFGGWPLAVGLVLFSIGGAVLFLTNQCRFGNGWEFGHRLNVSPAIPSIFSTRFDYPFKHVSLAVAAKELFGALFLTDHFNGTAWYIANIFPGQSAVFRKRGFDMTTYDLAYAILIMIAGIASLWCFVSLYRPKRTTEQKAPFSQPVELRGSWLLLWWGGMATALLAAFYLRVPVISDRYMLDFSPAFAALLSGLWLFLHESLTIANVRRPLLFAIVSLVLLGAWQGVEIARGHNAFGPPRSITAEDVLRQRLDQVSPVPLPSEYKIGDDMGSWQIPYNGAGWVSTNGSTSPCVIFYFESPQSIQIDLSGTSGSQISDGFLRSIRAKIGLETLKVKSIESIDGHWRISFFGPVQTAYQHGIQPVFLGMIPSDQLGEYSTKHTPFVLSRIRWLTSSR